ncbi:MAG: putative cytochrome hydroxylase [Actinomycetia bacterium]|jgi:cytochrome P450|nr:putative cytochrome hydroxylase [Actinomycetes bacterium]
MNVHDARMLTAAMDAEAQQRAADGIGLRTLIHMDDPQHRVVRAIGADWFKPRAMRAMEERVQELARHYVDRMSEYGGECDFATGGVVSESAG